jgi:hypothetical protein
MTIMPKSNKAPRPKRKFVRILQTTPLGYSDFCEVHVKPEEYADFAGLPGCPPIEQYPDGFYVLGVNQFQLIVGYFAWSQMARMDEIRRLMEESQGRPAEGPQELAIEE